MGCSEIADKVLGMLQRADGNDPSRGHLNVEETYCKAAHAD